MNSRAIEYLLAMIEEISTITPSVISWHRTKKDGFLETYEIVYTNAKVKTVSGGDYGKKFKVTISLEEFNE